MTSALELVTPAPTADDWRLYGRGTIDDRQPVRCSLSIAADGTWRADLSTFTLADTADLFFISDAGGHFCGPVFVERSRADTVPFNASTTLTGTGPLLVVAPEQVRPELLGEEILDGEVVD